MVAHALIVFGRDVSILVVGYPTDVLVVAIETHIDGKTSRRKVNGAVAEIDLTHTTQRVIGDTHTEFILTFLRYGGQLENEVVETKYHELISFVVAPSTTVYKT